MPARGGMTWLGSVEQGQQVFEAFQGTHFAVELEGFAEGVADAGVNGGRGHLHEATAAWCDPVFRACFQRFHGLFNV